MSVEKVTEKHLEAGDRHSDLSSDIVPLDQEEDRRILRKIDVHLLPFVALLYLLSFLWVFHSPDSYLILNYLLFIRDRSNIGELGVLFIHASY